MSGSNWKWWGHYGTRVARSLDYFGSKPAISHTLVSGLPCRLFVGAFELFYLADVAFGIELLARGAA
jgi:hypothetical protein